MPRNELKFQLLLGRRVYALNGRAIGRIEEAKAELTNGSLYVIEFMVGKYAIFERLSAWTIGRAILGLFGSFIKSGYHVPWDKIDFSDQQRPRLTCEVRELKPLDVSAQRS